MERAPTLNVSKISKKLMKLKNKLFSKMAPSNYFYVDPPMSIDPWTPGHLRDLQTRGVRTIQKGKYGFISCRTTVLNETTLWSV